MIVRTQMQNGFVKVKSDEGKKIKVNGQGSYSEWVGTAEQAEKRKFEEE